MLAKIRQLGIVGRIVLVSLVVSAGAGAGLWYLIRRDIASGAIGDAASSQMRLAMWIAAGFAALVLAVLIVVAATVRGLTTQAEQHEFDALHDPLTGLPNRTLFNDRIEQCVRERMRGEQVAALMLVDLDRFKEVNDTLGHAVGDELLKEVARRLSARLRRSDTVARLGGDEFGVLLPIVDGVAGATKVVEAIRMSLTAPLAIGGKPVTVDGSIGINIIDGRGEKLDVLMQRADTAMYRAKRGRLGYAIYDDEIDGSERDQLALVGELRNGIPRGELRLFYQPKAEVDSRKIRGVEALVRWQHPTRGLLTPNVFISLAEQNGLIRDLTFWVLDEAMRQAREWAEKGQGLKIAVNLSQESLLDPTMPAEIMRALRRHRVPAKALEIEITESALVSDLAAANTALMKLHEMGIALSIDDYGTGHSSLAHVRGLPVSCIKIDRSYVSGMLVDQKNATIVRSTIDLARDLGIGVVAEGVEKMDEWEALEELGCHTAQGYLISEPKPAAELFAWLVATGSRFRMDAQYEASRPLPDFA